MPVYFFILFGHRCVTRTTASGQFQCPKCGPARYRHRTVRRFFHLYFIPLIPKAKVGEYVECGTCKGTFKPAVLSRAAVGTQ